MGRSAGFGLRSEVIRAVPAVVRSGNLARWTFPVVCGVLGRRSERALGRRLKPGQVASVGMPQSSNIWREGNSAHEAHNLGRSPTFES